MERTWIKNETGLTLIELLGSITILSIVIMTFLAFFIQSAKSTKVSEQMMDATYATQQYVETVYHESIDVDYQAWIEQLRLEADQFHRTSQADQMTVSYAGYRMDVLIEPVIDQENNRLVDLYRVLVKTYDQQNVKQAQIETKLVVHAGGDTSG